MSKKILCIIPLILTIALVFTSCGNSISSSKKSTHKHSYGAWEIEVEATCTTEGIKCRYCSCGKAQTKSISVSNHAFGSWTVVKEATATEAGLEKRICHYCGETETRSIAASSTVTAITKNEWKNAFDFSTQSYILVSFDELCSEAADNEVYGIRGTLTVQNGVVYRDIIEFWDDEEEAERGYASGVLNTFFDVGDYAGDWLWELGSEIESKSDYGFSLFNYSQSSNSYTATINVDGILCTVSFWLSNKQITKITISGRNSETSINCSYTFSYH